ncbi:MAG: acetyl-CoA C-acyltransferase FadA [Planctomycetales bacterium]|nr:acetyl-CoA C-acyltransferase FadA [Planctomycetales bacterium]NIN78842.1 acetyl-CoA C-acyltransferase FadA [Planctomycetales bacterium]NIO36006.1 acetyl-CoA C-acyltransferase FadA [Planctomycetales bacterium]NIP05895.1 acetyl-CoA C-acyltransferase FadA [Planctomycetales bacterium]NIP71407.1 acetyl-CoA C-acyltransferase FadA [Planctomycetales bacterium]
MNSAVVVDCVRTPIGRSHPERGVFRKVRSDDLAVELVKALLERNPLDVQQIEDVVLGNTQQQGEQGFDVARMVALMAGLPTHTGGTTVNRLCGSSLQALNQAAHAIMAGGEDVQIVGGLEHMQHIPMDKDIDINPKLFQHTSKGALMMGITAEFLAQTHGISREEQDQFALRSHRLADEADRSGQFHREIVPVWGRDEEGHRIQVQRDQCIRADTSLTALGALKPAFMPGIGTVTAGNSSPLNDGAAAMLVMSDAKAKALGLRPQVRVVATAVMGVDPCVMGTGPVPATQKALRRAGLSLDDIGLIELNEAFAAQALTCIRMLDADPDKVNVRGGAIAIGHPLGASGARIATTLIHNMIDRQTQFGLATMCIGVGQGIATIFELAA